MCPKSVVVLAIAAVAVMMCPLLAPAAEGADPGSEGFYVSQLDRTEKDLYEQIVAEFARQAEEPSNDVQFRLSVTADSDESAKASALETANNVLSAMYFTDPSHPWIWDYPVKGLTESNISASTSSEGTCNFTFVLSVPADVADNPETEEENELLNAMNALKEKVISCDGSVNDKVSRINDELRGIRSADDAEGEISNPYDALVGRSSSSAGVAAAFTIIASASGLDAVTVRSDALNTNFDATVPAYWNAVREEGSWYGVNCTLNGDDHRNCLMAGMGSPVAYGSSTREFGGIFGAVNLDMASQNDLTAPALAAIGVEWPDDTPFYMKYGGYIVLVIIAVVIVAMLVHAIRTGNVRCPME